MAAFVLTESPVRCRLTPVEVENRKDVMAAAAREEALAQATALSELGIEIANGQVDGGHGVLLPFVLRTGGRSGVNQG